MNFAALPPEVNSGLMYAGRGPGPMLTAAAAWSGLAAELHSAATSYESLVSELTTGPWVGPSSAAMAAAVTPYLAWMNTTAIQAEKTATQVTAAVAAYEAAFAMTVPPTVVAANRTLLMTLVATNILGQNSPAIAANEAQYGEMWAQDAAAMYGYAVASPSAAEMEPFTPPPQTTNPAGQFGQAAAVGQALGGSAGNDAQTLPAQLAAVLQGLAAPAQGTSFPAIPSLQAVPPMSLFDWLGILADEIGIGVALPLSIIGVWLAGAAMYYSELDSREILEAQDVLAGGQSTILDAIEGLLASGSVPSASLSSGGIPVSAGLGQAVSAGNLSVPPSWATAAPEIRTTAYAAPDTSAAAPGGLGTAFSQMAMAGMAGSALAGAVRPGRQASAGPGTGERPAPPARSAEPLSQGSPEPPPRPPAISVTEMAAGIRELGELRDSGLITEAEFTEQKRRLLSR